MELPGLTLKYVIHSSFLQVMDLKCVLSAYMYFNLISYELQSLSLYRGPRVTAIDFLENSTSHTSA